jgi:hypothetical protein
MCEACWIEERTTVVDIPGTTEQLLQVQMPVLLHTERRVEQCINCGELTIIGLYVRTEVPDPAPTVVPDRCDHADYKRCGCDSDDPV